MRLDTIKDDLIERYKGETSKQLAERYGVTTMTITHWLQSLGLKKPRVIKSFDYEGLKRDCLILYVDELQEKYGVGVRTIHNIRQEVLQKDLNANWRISKTCDDSLIKESSDFFYFVGFIMADGCIIKNSVRIKLQIGDYDHLVKLSKVLGFNGTVTTTNAINNGKIVGGPSCSVVITSEKLVSALNYYGICERKSGLENYKNIPDKYFYDFLRGFFDGDGSVGPNCAYFFSLGPIIEQIANKLNADGITCVIRIRKDGIKLCRTNVMSTPILVDRMYRGSTLFLDRKYQKMKGIVPSENSFKYSELAKKRKYL